MLIILKIKKTSELGFVRFKDDRIISYLKNPSIRFILKILILTIRSNEHQPDCKQIIEFLNLGTFLFSAFAGVLHLQT